MSSFTAAALSKPDMTKSPEDQSMSDCIDEGGSQQKGQTDIVSALEIQVKYSHPEMVTYCPTCTMPPEYCEHGSTFDLCLPWILKNCPEVLSDALLAKFMEQASIDGTADSNDKVSVNLCWRWTWCSWKSTGC